MKKISVLVIVALSAVSTYAQNNVLKVQKLVLDNGFTVLLNEDKTAKEVFGAVVVKAGSKNDPADATGMAHYLEHLLFKGTTELGTTDYLKEKPFLDSINIYYDLLGKTKDEAERKKIQLLINNQSVQASKYALPTEFDKLIKSIGGVGLNAFTQNDMTVYHNAFPGEQIEKWLDLYSHRFQNPVFRSFQSELEVVYEEKNRGMDNFQVKLIEEMNKNLFKYHPYGTQTTIGTTEHLKNPSLTKMYQYFNTYYVANNMALVLSGNFDAEKAIPIIKEKFSKLRKAPVPEFPKYPPTVFEKKEVMNVRYTPIKVSIMGFKSIPNIHPDKAALEVCNSLLFNESETGLLNKLQRDNKIMFAGSFNMTYNDDGSILFFVVPKLVEQSIGAAEELVMQEIRKIRAGEFTDKDLLIIKQELYRQRQQSLESVQMRTLSLVQCFGEGTSWEDFLNYNTLIDKVTKEDVIRVANKYFTENYFAIHSKTGFPKKDILQKPGFKPVVTDQKEESAYAKKFNSTISTSGTPKFLSFDKDANMLKINESDKLYVVPNKVNDIFSLRMIYMVGDDSIKNLDVAAGLGTYLHTKDLSLDQVKEQFALLGITYSMRSEAQRFIIELEGLEKNFEKALPLLNKLLTEPVADDKSLKVVQNDIVTNRKAEEKQPQLLGSILYDYVRYGNESDYLTRVSTKDLKKLTLDELIGKIKLATSFNVTLHYVGTTAPEKVKEMITKNISLPDNKKFVPMADKPVRVVKENSIYMVNDKKAVQTQVYFLVNSSPYNGTADEDMRISAFNQYMGGSFSGLILQEIREFRSLAYSAGGSYIRPKIKNNPSYFYSTIGCQADKTIDAIETMHNLLAEMPQKPERLESLKSLLKNSAGAAYPDFRYISSTIDNYRQRGYTSDPRAEEFKKYDALTFEDVVKFYQSNLKSKPTAISIYGNKSRIDMTKLGKYGKINELKRKDIMVD